MQRRWKTSTALIASMSLIMPVQVTAQSANPVPEFLCADGRDLPCPSGIDAMPSAEMTCEDGAELPCADGVMAAPRSAMICDDGAELPCTEGVAASLRPEFADTLAEMRAQTVAETATDVVLPDPVAKAASEATTETTVEATTEAPVPEAEAEVTEAPAADASTEITADATVEPEPLPQVEAAPETAVAEPEVPKTVEAPEPETETTTAKAELAAALAAETADTAVPETPATAEPAEATATTEATAETTATAEPAPVPELPAQPEAASGEASVAAATQAPAEAEATTEVTEEVVTEETARSSDEDFANKVNETAAPAASAEKSGLSKGEKAILLGLGAIAVGAILSKNRQVALNSGDRVVVSRDDGSFEIIKDDNALLRQPGSTVRTETFGDGSTRTTITREDGTKIVTIRDAEYRVLRRVHVSVDGSETLLIDDTVDVEPIDFAALPAAAEQMTLSPDASEAELRAALARDAGFDRSYSLAQVRGISQVRTLVPVIDLNTITFETGSAAINPDQARSLSRLGRLLQSYIFDDPREVFLIEGHTDAVGSAAYNLALSDRRAESVALALTEYFDVPPENLVVQGYGEQFLKIQTEGDERANRRASVRRITDLLHQASY